MFSIPPPLLAKVMFPSKSSSPASIFVLPRDAAADFKNKISRKHPPRRSGANVVAEIRDTRALFFQARRVSRIHISLPREKPAHYTSRALLPFSNIAPAFSSDGVGGVAGEGGGTGGQERERDRPISCDADVYRQTKCNRRTAISFVSRTPARGKGVEEGRRGRGREGERKIEERDD